MAATQSKSVTAYQKTSLAVSAASGTVGTPTAVTATLRALPSNDLIAGESIAFTFTGNPSATSPATTNASGVATVNPVFPSAGTFNATADFSHLSAFFADHNGALSTETASNSVTITSNVANLAVSAPAAATGGTSFNVTVTARDSSLSTATGYRGTIHFTSSDGAATVPANYTFLAADNGVHTFPVTLNTAGTKTITATDTTTSSITGTASVVVSGNTTTALTSSLNPSLVGQSVTFTANVTSTTTGAITGTVTFKDGATTIGTGTLGSPATFSTSSLGQGAHSITAVYNGTANFNTSTSGVVTQTVNLSPFGAPPFFSATAASTSSVTLNWLPVQGATSYEVYRATSKNGPYNLVTLVGNTDSGLSPNTTYLYKIRAIGMSGPSAYSPVDPATTVVFTNLNLSGVPIRIEDIAELRIAVNAMRAAGALLPATFTDPTLARNVTFIKRVHIVELRQALDEARAAIPLAALGYTDPTITPQVTAIKAAHITELRDGVR
jgi:hypothetical protein